MWYSEDDKRWYCTNPKCVKYKPQPEPEDNGEEDNEDSGRSIGTSD